MPDQPSLRYRRILLKLSGEALKGREHSGIDQAVVMSFVRQIAEIHRLGVQVGVVIGGGNYFRGAQAHWMERAHADYIGMMATIMNALTLEEACRQVGCPSAVFSGLSVEGVVSGYEHRKMLLALEQERCVIIFAGGTGSPFFSTDTAAALRAHQMNAEILLKGTQVDGVYDADPRTCPTARKLANLTYLEVLQKDLRVMDATSVSFCREYHIPILVFDISQEGHLKRVVLGEPIGTYIGPPNDSEMEQSKR